MIEALSAEISKNGGGGRKMERNYQGERRKKTAAVADEQLLRRWPSSPIQQGNKRKNLNVQCVAYTFLID